MGIFLDNHNANGIVRKVFITSYCDYLHFPGECTASGRWKSLPKVTQEVAGREGSLPSEPVLCSDLCC